MFTLATYLTMFSVRENGGSVKTRRTGKENEILIYGGKNQRRQHSFNLIKSDTTELAPDIKRIIKEDEQNLVYPQWILDCAKRRRLSPLRSK
jgi:hypothetical protein